MNILNAFLKRNREIIPIPIPPPVQPFWYEGSIICCRCLKRVLKGDYKYIWLVARRGSGKSGRGIPVCPECYEKREEILKQMGDLKLLDLTEWCVRS